MKKKMGKKVREKGPGEIRREKKYGKQKYGKKGRESLRGYVTFGNHASCTTVLLL